MIKHAVIVSAAIMTAFACTAQANTQNLSGEEIAGLISDKKVVLATKWGAFPLRYQSSKAVIGDGSGLGLAKFFAPKETGKWWVKGENLCQQFPTWYKGKALCFTIQQTGPDKITWVREDGYSGTATIHN